MEPITQRGISQSSVQRYLNASKQIQQRLRLLLAKFHDREVSLSEIEPQEYNITLRTVDDRLVYHGAQEAKSGKYHSFDRNSGPVVHIANGPNEYREAGLPLGKEVLSDFNKGFLSFFEPVLTYGELGGASENARGDGGWTTRPLWLAALEVEGSQMRYTLFANGHASPADRRAFSIPNSFFRLHRIYDHIPPDKGDRELLPYDQTTMYRELGMETMQHYTDLPIERKHLPVIVAVVDNNEDPRAIYSLEDERWGYGMPNGFNFNLIILARSAAQRIDEVLCQELPLLGSLANPEDLDGFKKLSFRIARSERPRISVSTGGELDLSGHPWYESRWNHEDSDTNGHELRRIQIIQYFVWLRALSIARANHQAETSSEEKTREVLRTEAIDNFKTYVYFPNLDLSGNYIHTVTLAFPTWPDPDLLLLLDRELPKLFQRSSIRLAKGISDRRLNLKHENHLLMIQDLAKGWFKK